MQCDVYSAAQQQQQQQQQWLALYIHCRVSEAHGVFR